MKILNLNFSNFFWINFLENIFAEYFSERRGRREEVKEKDRI